MRSNDADTNGGVEYERGIGRQSKSSIQRHAAYFKLKLICYGLVILPEDHSELSDRPHNLGVYFLTIFSQRSQPIADIGTTDGSGSIR